jgi:hypothetical protein
VSLKDCSRHDRAASRPVSRAQRSIPLHRQTDERPSLPSGFGNPALVRSTFTRCGEILKRLGNVHRDHKLGCRVDTHEGNLTGAVCSHGALT